MKTIIFVLHDHFAVRNFLYSPFINQDFSGNNLKVVFVVDNPEKYQAAVKNKTNLILEKLEPTIDSFSQRLKNKIINFLYKTIEYRFNKISGFKHLIVKESIPKEYIIHKAEDSFKFLVRFPLPKSKNVFSILKWLYNSPIFLNKKAIELINKYSPDIIITSNPQIPHVRSYHILGKRKKIKTISYVNSWDYLTTDGPVLKDIDEFIVWNERGKKELEEFHKTTRPIHNIGPIHMDNTFLTDYTLDKEAICNYFNIDPKKKIIILGVYHKRLGSHEPSIAEYIAKNILPKHDAYLIIRGHPYDETYYDRYGEIGKLPGVILCKGKRYSEIKSIEIDDQIILYSILKNCDLLICSATTLTLDAIRFNKPVINIGFDGNLKIPAAASVLKKYTYTHYAPLLTSGGIDLVKSFAELETSIDSLLAHPEIKTEGIKKSRNNTLNRLTVGRLKDFLS